MSGENCLAGLKILDLTQFEAGPSCTEALGWLGADVVKVENPGAGDPGRHIGRTAADTDALYFLQYNSNKRSAAINLKDPRGLEIVKGLAKRADVMIENFAPGAIERLGLGYEVIKAINPAIIYCQIKGFGAGSPYEKNLAFDMIAQAAGGIMSITGPEDGPPCKPGATIGDTGTGMLMAVSILGAYVRRLRTGQGEHLQVAMQDPCCTTSATPLPTWSAQAASLRRGPERRRSAAATRRSASTPARAVARTTTSTSTLRGQPGTWTRRLKVMGREDLIGDERYSTPAARVERRAEVDELVSSWTRQQTSTRP